VRSEYQRDLDRVIYDYYFRRLGEITQVSSGTGKILRHNRMTHSLKVAQVGRRLVQYLQAEPKNEPGVKRAGGINPDVVDAAGLLHDTGHPPFGHIGEEELNQLALRHGLSDGFEANAQTLRIIASLSKHQVRGQSKATFGLDLTHAVAAAATKYPWTRGDGRTRKWGIYETEVSYFEQYIRPLLPAADTPTLEAEIMDWADDITYAVHDLQDFFVDGLIPLHELRHTSDNGGKPRAVNEHEVNGFWAYATERLRQHGRLPMRDIRETFCRYATEFPERPYSGTWEEKAAVGHLASKIITDASIATSVKTNGRLHTESEMRAVIGVLKEITRYYVVEKPELISVQIGQRYKMDELFRRLLKWVQEAYRETTEGGNERPYTKDEQWMRQRRLPTELTEHITYLRQANSEEGAYRELKKNLVRGIIDYIASMTEAEVDDMYLRLTRGYNLTSVPGGRLD
jgi:dGTPase